MLVGLFWDEYRAVSVAHAGKQVGGAGAASNQMTLSGDTETLPTEDPRPFECA